MIVAGIRALLAGCLLATASLAEAGEAPGLLVLRPVVNLHSAPREDADVVSQALLGARLAEQERKDGWARIQADDAYTGWIRLDALRPVGASERYPASPEPGKALEVDALAAHLYQEPDVKKHAPVMTLPFGVRLERVLGGKEVPRWAEVRLPDGRQAWIQLGDTRTGLGPLSLEATLELAKRFLGITYTWGGTSSFGFDCSGFTQTLLRARGVTMPRDASVQATWGGAREVRDRADLKPGDLLFFREASPRIAHTGLYLGGGRFIHDSTSGRPGVQVSELAEPYWSKHLVAMRRIP